MQLPHTYRTWRWHFFLSPTSFFLHNLVPEPVPGVRSVLGAVSQCGGSVRRLKRRVFVCKCNDKVLVHTCFILCFSASLALGAERLEIAGLVVGGGGLRLVCWCVCAGNIYVCVNLCLSRYTYKYVCISEHTYPYTYM